MIQEILLLSSCWKTLSKRIQSNKARRKLDKFEGGKWMKNNGVINFTNLVQTPTHLRF